MTADYLCGISNLLATLPHYLSIHPFSQLLIQFRFVGVLEPTAAVLGQEMEYTLDRLSIHHRPNAQRQTIIRDYIYTYGTANLESQMNLKCTSLDCGGKLAYPERTCTDAEGTWKLHNRKELSQPGDLTRNRHAAIQQNKWLHTGSAAKTLLALWGELMSHQLN